MLYKIIYYKNFSIIKLKRKRMRKKFSKYTSKYINIKITSRISTNLIKEILHGNR